MTNMDGKDGYERLNRNSWTYSCRNYVVEFNTPPALHFDNYSDADRARISANDVCMG